MQQSDNSYEEIASILRGEPKAKNLPSNDASYKEIYSILNGEPNNEATPPEPAAPFNWSRFLGENLAKGVLGIGDLGELIGTLGGNIGGKQPPFSESIGGNQPPFSERAKQSFKNANWVDLDTQGEGTTPWQRIAGNAARWAGGSLVPIPGAGAASVLKGAAMGAPLGAASGTLQEAGASPLAADITALGAGIVAPGAISRLTTPKPKIPALPKAEERVANYLQNTMGENELNKAVSNIEGYQPSAHMPDYMPPTTEVAESPGIAQLHRLRYRTPGSGLPEREIANRETVGHALAQQNHNAATSQEIKGHLRKTLKEHKEKRHEATHEGYEKVKEMKNPSSEYYPSNLMRYIKNEPVAGVLESDLTKIKNSVNRKVHYTAEQKAYAKAYNMQPKMVREQLKPPEKPAISPANLSAVDKSINAELKALKKQGLGEGDRAVILRQAKEALNKDMEGKMPDYKQVRALYKKLSVPIQEMLGTPGQPDIPHLKKILYSKKNTIIPSLLADESGSQLELLKKVVGKDTEAWKAIQKTIIKHVEKQVGKRDINGKLRSLNYDKLENFLDAHDATLKQALEPAQLAFLRDLRKTLHGYSETGIAQGKNSITGGLSLSDTDLRNRLGFKPVNKSLEKVKDYANIGSHLLPAYISIPAKVGIMVSKPFFAHYSATHLEDTLKIVDKVLLDPKFAHKLMTHKFSSQTGFNKFITRELAAPITGGVTRVISKSEEKKQHD